MHHNIFDLICLSLFHSTTSSPIKPIKDGSTSNNFPFFQHDFVYQLKVLTFAVIEHPKGVGVLMSVELTNDHIRVMEDEFQVPEKCAVKFPLM